MPMQPLSGVDSSFLYLETPDAPMHVGSVAVYEGSLELSALRKLLEDRVHLVPRMRQRLVMVPLGLGKPYWVDDPDFQLDRHVQHIALPRPGDWKQLRRLASRIFAMPLDRSRPLWEMVLVEGLDNIPQVPPGSVALISRVHHAAIDGVSGADMLTILLDMQKEPRDVGTAPPFDPPPLPSELDLLRQSMRKVGGKPKLLPGIIKDAIRQVRVGAKSRVEGEPLPPSTFAAPRTPLNRPVSADRLWNSALLSLDRVRAIRKSMNCTLNDVVLSICAGALRRYLLEHDALPSEPLVSMVPVSIRTEEQTGAMGNRVGAMMIQLATDVEDPIERLKKMHEQAVLAKSYQNAVGAENLSNMSELVPFGLAGSASRLYSRYKLSELHNPMFNCTITNVPGPQLDLYLAGHKLLATMGMAPILDGMGLIITVFSYNGVLSLSPTSSPSVMPDLDNFTRYIREAANELEAAIEDRGLAKKVQEDAATEALTTEGRAAAFFGRMGEQLKTMKGDENGDGTFQFQINGPAPQSWVIALDEKTVSEGESADADATFTIEEKHFARILDGELDPQMAFVQGKLRIKGDVGKAMSLGSLLSGG